MLKILSDYLNIQGKPASYYTQKQKRYLAKKVDVGKGTPMEIRAQIIKGKRAGIDCSGLVANAINSIKPIRKVLRTPSKNPFKVVQFFLRPIQNTNVKLLIDPINSRAIKDVKRIQEMDLINVGDEHVMLVISHEGNVVKYMESSETKGSVFIDKIKITKPGQNLSAQFWSDVNRKRLFVKTPRSGVRRLKRF